MNAPAIPAAVPSLPCHVLVVDDAATNRQILAVFMKKLGHTVDLAVDGAEAVSMFAAKSYDLVIMDVMMPVMDGYEATRRIKVLCGDRWVPVIILSALDKDENLVIGLDAGADDYLPKPVNFVVLDAKLRSLTRTLALRRELEVTRRNLQVYHDEREAENTLAVEIFEQLMQRPGLADPSLHYWMSPASHFSGDIVAATAAINGRLYVLLADATGHGLAAAISVLPLMTQFYDSAGAGVPLGKIIYRINAQLCAALPVGRFVAASFICLDREGGRAELWLGGMPAALVIDPAGHVVRTIAADNLSLGIDAIDPNGAITEQLDGYPPGSQLVMFSDGLAEARNAAGEEFGLERVCAALAGAPAAGRLDAVKEAFNQHVGAQPPHDDITLLLIDLPVGAGH
jgi:two-component system, HptB-dependent secretion and biofilm response regulator